MTPLIKPIALLGGTLAVLLLGRKAEAAAPPPEPIPPPAPKPPIVPPPAPAPPIPPGTEAGFGPGAILGVIKADGVRLRAAPSETSATKGTLSRGALVELFADGHAPPTAAAPQGWERVRTANGIEGFVAAQFLTAQGVPGVPLETQLPETRPAPGPAPGPAPLPGQPEAIPQAPETQGTTTTEEGPLNVPITILTPEERAALGQLGDLFQGAPPRFGFFSPSIGARAPAYGQTMFVRPRQVRFSGLPSRLYQQSLYMRRLRHQNAFANLMASRGMRG